MKFFCQIDCLLICQTFFIYALEFKCILQIQGILYREYSDAKQSWQNDKNKLLQEKSEAEESSKQLEAKSTHLLVTVNLYYQYIVKEFNVLKCSY